MDLNVTQASSSLRAGQRELTGTYLRQRAFFADQDGDGGTLIGTVRPIGSTFGEITIRGRVESQDDMNEGLAYRLFGRVDLHPRFGEQFQFDLILPHVPPTERGVVKYLESYAEGIGHATAKKLWREYGADAVEVLTRTPERCVSDGILREAVAIAASESLREQAELSATTLDLFSLFTGRGFPRRLVHECVARWGPRAPEVIRRNPFRLLIEGLPGCGFTRADRLYCDLGLPPGRLKRHGLCAWHTLRSDTSGHTWHPAARAVQGIEDRVSGAAIRPKDALRLMIRAGWLSRRRDADGQLWLAESSKARHEHVIARRLAVLMRGRALWPTELPDSLSDHQRQTVLPILASPVGFLLGTPGTGKTFTAAAVIDEVVQRHGHDAVAVCAPTGKAAVRITSALQRYGVPLVAQTIHRLLRPLDGGESWRFAHGEDTPLPYRFIVVDEVSMCDAAIISHLLAACAPGTNLLFVGDPYQLPPVGHGAPLRDMVAAGVPHGKLTEIRRNAGMIVRACAAIKDGKPFETCDKVNLDLGDNLRLIEVGKPDQQIEALCRLLTRFTAAGRWDVVEDVQVIVARNATRRRINDLLQQQLNPTGETVEKCVFRIGDKVINLANGRYTNASTSGEQYVANGDMGRVETIAPRLMTVRLRDPERLIRVPLGKRQESDGDDESGEDRDADTGCRFTLAYAVTGHKFQGSECPVVIVLAEPAAGLVASREWWYTALSRARDLCILVGSRGTIEQQCRRVSLRDRKTFLKELVAEAVNEPR